MTHNKDIVIRIMLMIKLMLLSRTIASLFPVAREISEDVTFNLLSEKHEETSHEEICRMSIPSRGNSLMCGSLECLRRTVYLVHSK